MAGARVGVPGMTSLDEIAYEAVRPDMDKIREEITGSGGDRTE